MLTSPPTCGQDAVPAAFLQFTPWVLAKGAPMVSNSTPAEAVLSLCITVLLTKFTASESSRETPPPSQPATLLTMMLLVTWTEFQRQPLFVNLALKYDIGKTSAPEPSTNGT